MKRWIVSKPALEDLNDVWSYVARKSGHDETADRFVARIIGKFSILVSFPGIGRRADRVRKGSRAFPVEDYIIYYRISRGRIVVQRIIHGKRDQERAGHER